MSQQRVVWVQQPGGWYPARVLDAIPGDFDLHEGTDTAVQIFGSGKIVAVAIDDSSSVCPFEDGTETDDSLRFACRDAHPDTGLLAALDLADAFMVSGVWTDAAPAAPSDAADSDSSSGDDEDDADLLLAGDAQQPTGADGAARDGGGADGDDADAKAAQDKALRKALKKAAKKAKKAKKKAEKEARKLAEAAFSSKAGKRRGRDDNGGDGGRELQQTTLDDHLVSDSKRVRKALAAMVSAKRTLTVAELADVASRLDGARGAGRDTEVRELLRELSYVAASANDVLASGVGLAVGRLLDQSLAWIGAEVRLLAEAVLQFWYFAVFTQAERDQLTLPSQPVEAQEGPGSDAPPQADEHAESEAVLAA